MIVRITLRYEIDRQCPSEVAQNIILSLRKALPGIGRMANLREFMAHIGDDNPMVDSNDAHPFSAVHDVRGATSPTTSKKECAAIGRTHRKLRHVVGKLPVKFRVPMTLSMVGFLPDHIAELIGESTIAVCHILECANAILTRDVKGRQLKKLQ